MRLRSTLAVAWLLGTVAAKAVEANADQWLLPAMVGVRGTYTIRFDATDDHPTRVVQPPFTFVHGIAWSNGGRRCVIWGAEEPAAAADDAPILRRSPPVSITFGGDGGNGRTRALRELHVGAEQVLCVRWNRAGSRVLIVCRGAPSGREAPFGPQSLCVVTDEGGDVVAHAAVDGAIRSATAAPDGVTWLLIGERFDRPLILRWKPTATPMVLSWDLPTPSRSQHVAEIAEVAWNPVESGRVALAYRVAPADSGWVIGVLVPDGGYGSVAVRGMTGIRDVSWSPDGTRIAWIAPAKRTYDFTGLSLPIRYEVLWSALLGYDPHRVFDIIERIPFSHPESLTALDRRRTVEGYTWSGRNMLVVASYADDRFLPMRGAWWVPERGEPRRIITDHSLCGAVSVHW